MQISWLTTCYDKGLSFILWLVYKFNVYFKMYWSWCWWWYDRLMKDAYYIHWQCHHMLVDDCYTVLVMSDAVCCRTCLLSSWTLSRVMKFHRLIHTGFLRVASLMCLWCWDHSQLMSSDSTLPLQALHHCLRFVSSFVFSFVVCVDYVNARRSVPTHGK